MKSKSTRILLTLGVVAVAVILVLVKYRHYVTNPWTRNGQVRAQVIQMTARVTGPIVNLPIADNQFVKKDDVLEFHMGQKRHYLQVAKLHNLLFGGDLTELRISTAKPKPLLPDNKE